MVFNSGPGPETISCPIWTDFQASVYGRASDNGTLFVESNRAGGNYGISSDTIARLEKKRTFRLKGQEMIFPQVSDYDRTRLTTWLVDQRLVGEWEPMVTPEVISSVNRKGRLPVHERANRLLRLIANETRYIGNAIPFEESVTSTGTLPVNLKACAWSESNSWREVEYLIEYHVQNGLLQFVGNTDFRFPSYMVTVDGYAEIARQVTATDSAKAFVAMWFDESMRDAYYQGIEPAIKEAGYDPVRVDTVEHAGLIDDAIIAEIRKSRFVIADLTQGDDGARGGVYYEAGFAHGLGLTVIFTCRQEKFKLVHFDTNHQAHILWTDYEELRTRLRQRIEAVIGPGPLEVYADQEADC